jgi:crotonobetainyl-CoA:carnitine CoA-transferase CaiB-like acyl-CoA transferase
MTPGADLPPLSGVTVIEVGNYLAAPFAATQLADLGARVIKVESPLGGDAVRSVGPFLAGQSSPFIRLNRNKESAALDLKTTAGLAAVKALVAGADVLVENLRPGAMTQLGLGYEELSELNPRLIYASATGWGRSGPLAPQAGLDIMAQARSGLMSINGQPGDEPSKIGVPICDLVCALYLALGVVAALRARDRDGIGQAVEVSLYESGVSFAVWEAGKFFATGEVARPQGSAHQSLAPYQAIATRDGHITVGAVTPKTWSAFCSVLGLADAFADSRFATASSRHQHRAALIPVIETATRQWPKQALIDALVASGVPCAPLATYGEVFTDEHLVNGGFYWDATHPDIGRVRQLGSPVRLSRTPAQRGAAGPALGADTRLVLRSVGMSAAEIEEMIRCGAAAEPEAGPAAEAAARPEQTQ